MTLAAFYFSKAWQTLPACSQPVRPAPASVLTGAIHAARQQDWDGGTDLVHHLAA